MAKIMSELLDFVQKDVARRLKQISAFRVLHANIRIRYWLQVFDLITHARLKIQPFYDANMGVDETLYETTSTVHGWKRPRRT